MYWQMVRMLILGPYFLLPPLLPHLYLSSYPHQAFLAKASVSCGPSNKSISNSQATNPPSNSPNPTTKLGFDSSVADLIPLCPSYLSHDPNPSPAPSALPQFPSLSPTSTASLIPIPSQSSLVLIRDLNFSCLTLTNSLPHLSPQVSVLIPPFREQSNKPNVIRPTTSGLSLLGLLLVGYPALDPLSIHREGELTLCYKGTCFKCR